MDYHACIDLEIEGRVWCPQLDIVATIDADWPRMSDWYVTGIALEFVDGARVDLCSESWLYQEIERVLTKTAHAADVEHEWTQHRAAARASADRRRERGEVYA